MLTAVHVAPEGRIPDSVSCGARPACALQVMSLRAEGENKNKGGSESRFLFEWHPKADPALPSGVSSPLMGGGLQSVTCLSWASSCRVTLGQSLHLSISLGVLILNWAAC